MIVERVLNVYFCTICGKFYLEDDMIVYNRFMRQGKCSNCVDEMERVRKEYGVIGIEVDVENLCDEWL